VKDTYRYYILAYEDARQKRPIKHEYGGTTVLTDGAGALALAEVLAEEYPAGWVYIHVEYRRDREHKTWIHHEFIAVCCSRTVAGVT